MKLIKQEAVAIERTFVHCHWKDRPHTFEAQDCPIYESYPDGKRIRNCRVSLNINLREAAAILNLPVVEMSALERGMMHLPDSVSVEQISMALWEYYFERKY